MRTPALLTLTFALAGCATPGDLPLAAYASWVDLMNNTIALAYGPPPGPREPPHRVRMVDANESYIYVVPVEGGVVLIDSGFDTHGRALLEAVGDTHVLGVLITHAHRDHTDGAHVVDAPVFVGRDDLAIWRDEAHPTAFFSHASQHVVGASPLPRDLRPVDDGDVVTLGGEDFRALALPGHTPGSTCWRWRDVAFTGDAIVNMTGRALAPAPFTVTDDMGEAYRSFRRLLREDVSVILDAHYGRTNEPRRLLAEAIARRRSEGR
jgi:hydroxyacylglutathione hydrolase